LSFNKNHIRKYPKL